MVFPKVSQIGTKVKVTVSMRDVNGSVLPNRSVHLSSSITSLEVTPADTQTTNNNGQAQFFINSNTPGTVKLTVSDLGSNITIVNIPTVEFTQ